MRPKLTYANVVATLALFIAIGGASAFAASQLGKNTVGTKQLKKNSVTTAKLKNGAVTGSKLKLSTIGTVPSATHAASADNAINSDKLGGVGISGLVPQVAQSGEVLTGQLAQHYGGELSGNFFLAGDSYRSPLPLATPTPTLVYTTSTAQQCPGFGQAAAGVLCVYAYLPHNVSGVEPSGEFDGPNRRYGFSIDVDPENETQEAFLLASWAYQVP